MAEEDKLELAIKHNTKDVEAAEKERIQALKNQILSAEMADAENLNAIDKLKKSNEKFLSYKEEGSNVEINFILDSIFRTKIVFTINIIDHKGDSHD